MLPTNRGLTVTFGGGAWFALFYLGVAQYMSEHTKAKRRDSIRYAGTSAGSSAASALALGIEPRIIAEDLISLQPLCKNNAFRICKVTHGVAEYHIPQDDNVCRSVSDRLLLGLSEYKSVTHFKEYQKFTFEDREDLLSALKATCHLPILNGLSPVYVEGTPFFDGSITQNWQNLPLFEDCEDESVLRVTTKRNEYLKDLREGWITPRFDLPRRWQLFPPGPDALRFLMRLGYLRTWEYLTVYESTFFNNADNNEELQKELELITNEKHLVQVAQ